MGKQNDEHALKWYTYSVGHEGLTACLVNSTHFLVPHLMLMSQFPQSFDFAEVKCPYSCHSVSPVQECIKIFLFF